MKRMYWRDKQKLSQSGWNHEKNSLKLRSELVLLVSEMWAMCAVQGPGLASSTHLVWAVIKENKITQAKDQAPPQIPSHDEAREGWHRS